jgi:DNA (cytosine-5)-methyltransferase 1
LARGGERIRENMKHLGLFEGIGGFSLASRWMGWETIAWCEWNEFGQKILKHHFPNAEGFGDITKTNFSKYANKIDILTGGFPCQPYSSAGKRLGTEDDRHLWPEMLRVIEEVKPSYVVGENVNGITNWNGGLVFEEVQVDLERKGFEVQAFILPACGKDAPHKRDRVWFVAHSNRNRLQRSLQRKSYDEQRGYRPLKYAQEYICNNQPTMEARGWEDFPTKPSLCGRNDGIPKGLDSITISKWKLESIKALGNAIVPQVAFEIFKAIKESNLKLEKI